jgi:hypothetical protein
MVELYFFNVGLTCIMNYVYNNQLDALFILVCFSWRWGPTRAMARSFTRFLDHTKRRTTVGRTPLDE